MQKGTKDNIGEGTSLPTQIAQVTGGPLPGSEFLSSVPSILSYGVIGFGFLLMLFAYLLLWSTARSPNPNPLVMSRISGFMVISVVMTFLATMLQGTKEYYGYCEFRKTSTLHVWLSPTIMPESVTIYPELVSSRNDSCKTWLTDCKLATADDETITFKVDPLTEKIRQCEVDRLVEARVKAALGVQTAQLAKDTKDVGIGDVKRF